MSTSGGRLTIRRSVSVAVGAQAVTGLIAVGQSIILVAVAGVGVATDAFLAAYTAYLPIGVLAATVRISGIALVHRDGTAHDTPARVASLGFAVAASLFLLAPGLAWIVTRSLEPPGFQVALAALIILAVAGFGQLSAAGYAAALSAQGLHATSTVIYAAAGLLGLTISALGIVALGAVGSAVGVLAAAWLIVFAHVRLVEGSLRMRVYRPFVDRSQLRLAQQLSSAAAIPIAVQLHFMLALAFAPSAPNAVAALTFSFLFMSLLLSASFQVMGAMGVAVVSGIGSARRLSAARELLLRSLPASFCLAAALTLAVITIGPHAVEVVPPRVAPRSLVNAFFEYLPPIAVVAVPWGVQTMLFSVAVAFDRTHDVLRTMWLPFAVLLGLLIAMPEVTPFGFGMALFVAEATYALLVLRLVFGTSALAIAGQLGARVAWVLCAGVVIFVVGAKGDTVAVLIAMCGVAALFILGLRLSRRVDRWLADNNVRSG